LEDKIRQIPGLEDVSSDLQVKNQQVRVDMNRDRIAALGLTVNQVETALNNAYGSRQVSQIYAPNNQYQVVMQVAPEFQRDPAALSMLYVRASGGRLIPLDTLAIVVIYIVLGVLYESFTHPLTILSGLPAAGFGALLTLLLFKAELSLYAF